MILRLLTYPLISVVSRFAGFTRWIGSHIQISALYRWLFERIVGTEIARENRDLHMERVAMMLKEEGIEIEETGDELVKAVRSAERRTTRKISDGESVIAIGLAVAGVFASPIYVATLAFILLISVSVRLTSVEVLAYTDPSPDEDPELLLAMYTWNEQILSKTHVARHTLGIRIFRDFDPRFVELYLDEVFVPLVRGEDLSMMEVWERLNPELMEMVGNRMGFEVETEAAK